MEENTVNQTYVPVEPPYSSQDAPDCAEGNYTTPAVESERRAAQPPYSEVTRKTTADFINQLDNGSIIAVQTAYNKAVSVIVISHERDIEGNVVRCKAKGRDGTIYDVPRKAIIWHKINKRYPAWVYEKIKNGEGDIYAKIDKTADAAGTDVGTSE